MIILVDGKKAFLKSGFSFDYVSENRLFLGRDGYTLSLSFPLKNCPENIEIFGHIHRADADVKKIAFECAIIDSHVSLVGALSIVKISDTEVEGQFSEGRCEQVAIDPFDETYINELDLGDGSDFADFAPEDAWNPAKTSGVCVALPWVNNNTGALQNIAYFDENTNKYCWGVPANTEDNAGSRPSSGSGRPHLPAGTSAAATSRSWQPYLLYIAKAIIDAVGYSYDLAAWENSSTYRYLLVCNTLPAGWNVKKFARALPHWTVSEFFEKLELFLGGEFDFDHKSHHVVFSFSDDAVAKLPPVHVEDVIDEYSTKISEQSERCDYLGVKNLSYKLANTDVDNFYSCAWFLKSWNGPIYPYTSLTSLLADNKQLYKWSNPPYRPGSIEISRRGALFYAADVDAHFVVRCVGDDKTDTSRAYTMELRPVNLLGDYVADDSEDAQVEDIEFIPVSIDLTEESLGRAMFLSFSAYDEEDNLSANDEVYQTQPVKLLMAGEKDSLPEYYNSISLAWWAGAFEKDGHLPHPHVERIEIAEDWSGFQMFNLPFQLNHPSGNNRGCSVKIDQTKKYLFSFLSDVLPNARSIFYIKGKRYICEKITATFTENGMSQLLKGEFYPVLDED